MSKYAMLVQHCSQGRSLTVRTQDFGGDVSLHRYMTLPIEQYFVLDPSQIQFLGGDRFLLLVPRINVSPHAMLPAFSRLRAVCSI